MDQELNIVYLVNEFTPSTGGWQTHAYQLAREVGKRHNVTVIAPDYPDLEDTWDYQGIDVIRFKRKNMRSFLANSRKSVRRLLKGSDVDLLHPLMVYPAGYVASWFGKPIVVTAHGNDLFERTFTGTRMIERALGKADSIICVSKGTRDLLKGIARRKATVIPNGVHPDEFRRDSETCRGELGIEGPQVLSVCRLVKRKGIDDLIQAAPEIVENCPEASFVIIGEGPEQESLKFLTKECGVEDRFHFLGRVEEKTLKQYLCASDVFAMPSRRIGVGDIEGFGIVFLEANASGTPVVGTRSGGITDAIEDGRSGFIVDDTHDLAEKISILLNDRETARKMGMYGRERVLAHFSWKKVAARTIGVYEDVFDRKH